MAHLGQLGAHRDDDLHDSTELALRTAKNGTFEHRTGRGIDAPEERSNAGQSYSSFLTGGNARVQAGNVYNNTTHQHYYPGSTPSLTTTNTDEDKLFQALLDALAYPELDFRAATIASAHSTTCQWVFETPEYKRWLDPDIFMQHMGFLWIKGKPGAGKSTVMKCALEHAHTEQTGKVVSFFFSARGNALEKSTEGLYRSMLHALLDNLSSVKRLVSQAAVTRFATSGWPLEVLKDMLRETIRAAASRSRLVCYIDALEEGDDEDDMRDMISFLEDLTEATSSQSHQVLICLASRHYPKISLRAYEELVLDNHKGHNQDIASYVQSKLIIQNSSLKSEIATQIREKSSGIFLWVVLVVRALNKTSDNGNWHLLRSQLTTIPGKLDELLQGIVHDGASDPRMLPVLLITLFARRTLSPIELYCVVTVCIESTIARAVDTDHQHIDTATLENFILSSSKGLLETVACNRHTGPQSPKEQWTQSVQFVHESVRDYLFQSGIQRVDSSFQNNPMGMGSLRMAQWCKDYLGMSFQSALMFEIEKTCVRGEIRKYWPRISGDLPFFTYALSEILQHSEDAARHGMFIEAPFCDDFPDYAWLCLTYLRRVWKHSSLQPTVLHILARQGHINLLRQHLEQFPPTNRREYVDVICLDPDSSRRIRGTALHIAVAHGFTDIVTTLLQHNADINKSVENLGSPLHIAVRYHDLDLAEWLLKNGAEVDRFDGHHENDCTGTSSSQSHASSQYRDSEAHSAYPAVHVAVRREDIAMVRMLFKHGADPDAHDSNCDTGLHVAVRRSNDSLVNTLLEFGADVNIGSSDGDRALHLAARSKRLTMIKMLQEHGADINARGAGGDTALHIATRTGNFTMVRGLLNYGSDVNARNVNSDTPLHVALRSRATIVVDAPVQHNGKQIPDNVRRQNPFSARRFKTLLPRTNLCYEGDDQGDDSSGPDEVEAIHNITDSEPEEPLAMSE